jgi:hypothetical protein
MTHEPTTTPDLDAGSAKGAGGVDSRRTWQRIRMPESSPEKVTEQTSRLRKTMFVAGPALIVGTVVGAAINGNWQKLVGIAVLAVILLFVGIFAPQIVNCWNTRNDPRRR